MKLKITLALLFTLGLTACGGEEATKEKSAEKALVVPSWVQNKAADQEGLNAVVTVSNVVGKETAIKEAFAEIASKAQASLLAEREARIVTISSRYTGLENKIRHQVASGLPSLTPTEPKVVATFSDPKTGDISVWAQLNRDALAIDFKKSLKQVDAHLKQYIHISDKGSNLTQMYSILPALPTLEMRRELQYYLAKFEPNSKKIALPNDQLAEMLDIQLSNQFDSIVLTLDATTEGSSIYERSLTQQLKKRGFNLSARKPDLLLKYYIEKDVTEQNGIKTVTLVTDAEIVNNKGVTIATVSQKYSGLDRSETDALVLALGQFSTDIMTVVASSAIDFMDKVNKDIPLPTIYKR